MSRGRLPPEFLKKIKDAVNIIDVIGEHVVLKKTGSNFVGLCPFHNERSPSFSVSEPKQLYHCYGCKKGGDLLSFVMELHGLGFIEAIEELADRAKMPLPKDFNRIEQGESEEQSKRRLQQREKLSTAWKLNRFAAKFFRDELSKNKRISDYFKKRGITPEISQDFYIGASPDQWESLSQFFQSAKAPLPLASELGLIKPSTKKDLAKSSGYFDLFRNRAMFPILDLRGKVVGFGGRATGDDTPKYLNSSDSFLFQKSKLLYGMFQAQKHIRETDEVLLVEGYFDVLALHVAGFKNAVATCGTALTPEHLDILRKFCTKITIVFDGDKAGVAATERAMEVGLQKGLILHGVVMPEGMDPDEILLDAETGKINPKGVDQMRTLLLQAQPLLDSRIETEAREAGKNPEAKTRAIKKIANWLSIYNDPVGREVRIENAVQFLKIHRSVLEQAGGIKSPTRVVKATQRVQSLNTQRQKLSPWETVLVTGLSQNRPLKSVLSELGVQLPPGMSLSEIADHNDLKHLLSSFEENNKADAHWLERVEDPQVRTVISAAMVGNSDYLRDDFSNIDFRGALQHGIIRAWARFSQGLKQRLQDAELNKDVKLHADLLKEYLDVQRRMKEFGSSYDEV